MHLILSNSRGCYTTDASPRIRARTLQMNDKPRFQSQLVTNNGLALTPYSTRTLSSVSHRALTVVNRASHSAAAGAGAQLSTSSSLHAPHLLSSPHPSIPAARACHLSVALTPRLPFSASLSLSLPACELLCRPDSQSPFLSLSLTLTPSTSCRRRHRLLGEPHGRGAARGHYPTKLAEQRTCERKRFDASQQCPSLLPPALFSMHLSTPSTARSPLPSPLSHMPCHTPCRPLSPLPATCRVTRRASAPSSPMRSS